MPVKKDPRYKAGDSSREQHHMIAEALIGLGYDSRAERLAELSRVIGKPVPAFGVLTHKQAAAVILGLADRIAHPERESGDEQ